MYKLSRGKRIARYTFYTFITLLVAILVLGVGGIGVGTGMVTAIVKDEQVREADDFQKKLDGLFQNSYAYFQNTDKDGNPILIGSFRLEGNNRNLIESTQDVSPHLVNAFISTEDRDFYEHNGIVPRSIIRASLSQVSDIFPNSGGSTITQQLVKNVILNNREQSIERKAKEIILSLRLESLYKKDEILVHYMNSVYFGSGANNKNLYGVQAAAKGLFNVEVKDLSIPQAAYIAGMVQRPIDYNPFEGEKQQKLGLERMKLVLNEMLENKKITQAEHDEALQFDLKSALAKPEAFKNSYSEYPFIMHQLEAEAAEILMEKDGLNIATLSKEGKYGVTLQEYKKKVMTGGYHIYATIDQKMYEAVNREATKGIQFHKKTHKGVEGQEQIGATIIENKTGAILAFVSGSNKDFNENQKDHALNATNQPGSTIKPLLVYGPGMDQGIISSGTNILDEPIKKSGTSEFYKNANGRYSGIMSVTTALKHSINIPAIKIFNALGHETGFDYMRKLGIPPHPNDGESASIGGVTNGFTVAKMTAAFATFPNNGSYNKPHLISKIVDQDGEEIWNYNEKPVQIYSPQASYATTQIMRQVVTGGTASRIGASLSGYPIAGKTGTTNEYRDVWFIGYTPQISLGVWGGYDYNHKLTLNKNIAKTAWINIFKAAATASPNYFDKNASFTNPGGSLKYVSCLDCESITKYKEKKKKEEEEEKKKEEEKENEEENGDSPVTPTPTNPRPPTPPGGPGGPGDDLGGGGDDGGSSGGDDGSSGGGDDGSSGGGSDGGSGGGNDGGSGGGDDGGNTPGGPGNGDTADSETLSEQDTVEGSDSSTEELENSSSHKALRRFA
ncbi:penicillin-binding protein [Hazenella sp. IB182357]|uniref:Penicillin-binding protein n=1 Tax=Polycladospora coralii TaxID=2771432 RepID=A0A926RSY2_9BACL|nr:transglycosylase domain-containing protein [Polycladospora coralii]MBD1370933.1 penicillin-binding protein [Polycladospora coralii]MBS7529872.1 penicillin-binding protein [Polycladospora coralii]